MVLRLAGTKNYRGRVPEVSAGSGAFPGRLIRVLVVIDSLGLGGAESLVATFARLAGGARISVDVASITDADDRRSAMVGELRSIGLEPTFLSIPRLLSPRAIPAMVRAIRTSECDVVHAHLEYAATIAPPAARLVGRPAVCSFHHIPATLPARDAVRERLAVAVAGQSRRVLFVSRASMDAFAASYRRRTNWTVLNNGISLDEFTPEPADFPPDLGIPAGSPVVTVAAALRSGKGQELAIAAWPAVRRTVGEARLLLVGSGDRELSLRALAGAVGVQDAVVFAGYRNDIARIMRASTLVLLASDSEALPTVLIEAAACGRAVVASRVGGTPEVVADGETGLLVPAADTEALAGAVIELLCDDRRRRAMGSAARRLAERRFDARIWVDGLRRIYDEAIAGNGH
jgi:glycosyltransferase involved in cell wall biosynthesis